MTDQVRRFERTVWGVTLLCDVIPMGRDYAICVRSDSGGHVGSVAMAVARPSLTGEGVSATTSTLNCLGHKDDAVANRLAAAVAAAKSCTAVCACGIHIDSLAPEGIQAIVDACREMEEEILQEL
ncbi:MAG: hypothetical protein LUC30_01510 [Clostridiales bacterium]|nr:hypothetical protein [Clostridiales bacterium]